MSRCEVSPKAISEEVYRNVVKRRIGSCTSLPWCGRGRWDGQEAVEIQVFERHNDVRNDESGHSGAVVESANVALVSITEACSCRDDIFIASKHDTKDVLQHVQRRSLSLLGLHGTPLVLRKFQCIR